MAESIPREIPRATICIVVSGTVACYRVLVLILWVGRTISEGIVHVIAASWILPGTIKNPEQLLLRVLYAYPLISQRVLSGYGR